MSKLRGHNPGSYGANDIREFGSVLGLSDSANEHLPAALDEMCISGRIRLVPITENFGIYLQSSLARYFTDNAAVSTLRDSEAGTSVEFVVQGILDDDLLNAPGKPN
jgi:vacuolar-type H+-ATPase catalytic subunit A/Vma1